MGNSQQTPAILERRFVPEGSIILKEGEEGNTAYLVQSGSVVVYTQRLGEDVIELATLGTGEIFGEMALIADQPRKASVRAVEDCTLIVISRDKFEKKLKKSDPTIKAMVEMLSKRMLAANDLIIRGQLSTIDDLVETMLTIYKKLEEQLPDGKQDELKKTVLPKMDELVKMMVAFKKDLKG